MGASVADRPAAGKPSRDPRKSDRGYDGGPTEELMTPEEYASYDALGLAERVARGEVEPRELLDAALARAAATNPTLNAIVVPMEDEARRAIEAGLPDGPLRGVPYLLKDLGTPYAGVRLTNGCRLFEDFVPDHDSELVARYKRAGLVTFGRSASPEFGSTATTESALFGATRNPWDLERTPGGSSGGAAAAVAAGILPAANASDGGGSIRIPASCCGLFGMKPTRGRNPAGPDVGEGWSGMSAVHVVSRSVRDSAALLDATAGPDVGAPYWAVPPERPYLEEVGAPPRRLRIAWQTRSFNGAPVHADCTAAAEETAKLCAKLGHTVEEACLEVDAEVLRRAAGTIISANLRATLDDRARALGRDLSPDDVEPVTWRMAEDGRSTGAAEYARAVRVVHATGRVVARYFESWDAILSPTLGTPPPRLGVLSLSNPDVKEFATGLAGMTAFTQLMNVAGNPAMSVPLHWSAGGMPIGVQLAAPYGDEATLFRLAGQLEEARPWADRRPPFPG
jgi:amidase/6-aminohexanoate-cyclic-dimer hydrolase